MKIRIYQTSLPSGIYFMAARLNRFTMVRIYTADTPKAMRIADFWQSVKELLA